MNIKSYNDEMFDFLTIKENFYAALELKENLLQVERKLEDIFWQEVTNSLKEKLDEYRLSNSIQLEVRYKNLDKDCHWFEIRRNDWEFYFISTEKDDVGIKIIDSLNMAPMNAKQIEIELLIKDQKESAIVYNNLTWPCYKSFDAYKFDKFDDKVRLLPENSASLINQCANEVFVYVKQIIKACDDINSKISVPN